MSTLYYLYHIEMINPYYLKLIFLFQTGHIEDTPKVSDLLGLLWKSCKDDYSGSVRVSLLLEVGTQGSGGVE